jgi:hypothetical protein
MSFARTLESNTRNVDKEHLPLKINSEIHSHDKNGWKASNNIILPPICRTSIRSKPQSGFNQATLISNNGQLDFHLNSAGYIEKLYLEMELTVANNQVTVLFPYIIDRVEFLSSEGNIMQTIYGDNIYLEKIHTTLEQHNRFRGIENMSASYEGQAIPVGNKRVVFHIPCFVDQTHPKLSVIKSKVICRVYFSNLGVTAGLASDISVSLCDIIQYGQQLGNNLEALENQRKAHGMYHFRIANPIRVASQTIAMVASGTYDIRLTSANNMSAFLVFVVRPAPLSTANITSFQAIDYYELLDSDNTIQGIKISNEYHKVLTNEYDGDIFNYKNIYVVPFSIAPKTTLDGNQTGFYSFTSNEILRLYMPANLVNGSFRVDVYSFDYNRLSINNGTLLLSK